MSPVVGLSILGIWGLGAGIEISILVSFPLLGVPDSPGGKDRPGDKLSQLRNKVQPGTHSLSVLGVWIFDIISISPRFEIAFPPYQIIPEGDRIFLSVRKGESILEIHIETGGVFPDIDFYLPGFLLSSGESVPLCPGGGEFHLIPGVRFEKEVYLVESVPLSPESPGYLRYSIGSEFGY